jgi:hypothetical protein
MVSHVVGKTDTRKEIVRSGISRRAPRTLMARFRDLMEEALAMSSSRRLVRCTSDSIKLKQKDLQ